MLLALLGGCREHADACATYTPRDGDIVFHSSRSEQSLAIVRLTHLPYTHMGVVFLRTQGPFVLEAAQPVRWTPLDQWIARGEGGHFVVRRLADAPKRLTPRALARLRSVGEDFVGRAYDTHLAWSDERLYCSELAWKLFRRGLGIELAPLQRIGDYNLDDPLVRTTLGKSYGASDTRDELAISPAAIFDSPWLVTAFRR